jgi:hypothetical protein
MQFESLLEPAVVSRNPPRQHSRVSRPFKSYSEIVIAIKQLLGQITAVDSSIQEVHRGHPKESDDERGGVPGTVFPYARG